MAEGPGPRQPLAKCEFSISSVFDISGEKMWSKKLITFVHCEIWSFASTNSSSYPYSVGAFKWTRFSRQLAFVWTKAGDESSWASNNWEKLQRGQCTLQAWDVESLASKCRTAHMESSWWCSLSDGRAWSCFENTKKAFQLLYWHWCVSNFKFRTQFTSYFGHTDKQIACRYLIYE